MKARRFIPCIVLVLMLSGIISPDLFGPAMAEESPASGTAAPSESRPADQPPEPAPTDARPSLPLNFNPKPQTQTGSQTGNAATDQEAVPMKDIHDLKPPEPAGFSMQINWRIIALIAGTVAAALLLFLLWKKYRRAPSHKTAPSLSPEEAALIALNEISDVENTDGKQFHFRLSAIVRHYLEGRFGVSAPEMTTEELIPCIETLDIGRELQNPLKKFFRDADPVKYADALTVAAHMRTHLDLARRLVKETAPRTGEA